MSFGCRFGGGHYGVEGVPMSMEVDADDKGVLLILSLVNVASLGYEGGKLLKTDMGVYIERPSTVILPDNTKMPILNLRRLLMRRD